MPQTQSSPTRRISSTALRTGIALIIGLGFVASACANSPNPCGDSTASTADRQTRTFRDPYTQRKHFVQSVAEYREVVARNNEGPTLRDAKWKVCINAQGLAPYTREVASDIRPRFSRAMAALISVTRDQSEISASPLGGDKEVDQAVDEFVAAMPRFWRSPAASLRGARQPGSPLHTHY